MTEDGVGTVGLLATELPTVSQPLEDHLTPDGILSLFLELGSRLPAELVGKQGFAAALPKARDAVTKLPDLVTALAQASDLDSILDATSKLVDAIVALAQALDSLADAVKAVAGQLSGVSEADVAAFALDFVRRLLEYLVVLYLEGNLPRLAAVLALLGIVEIAPDQDQAPTTTLPPYMRRSLRFDNISNVLNSVEKFFHDEYGWGATDFNARKLLSRVNDLLFAFGVPAKFKAGNDTTPARLDIVLIAVGPEADPIAPGAPRGISARLLFGLQDTFTVQWPFFIDGWRLEASAKGALDQNLTATLKPPGSFLIKPPTGTLDGQVSLAVVGERPDPTHPNPFRVLRIPGVGGVEAGRVRASAGTAYHFDTTANASVGDPTVEFKLEKGKLSFAADSEDGFLAEVLPKGGVGVDFDFGIGWSRSRGVFFSGSAGLEITIYIARDLGPVRIASLHRWAKADGNGLNLE